MTQLYLIRHGIAIERADGIEDETRPLTKIGQQKTRQVAHRLKAMTIKFDIIVTSPFIRARQTAEILHEVNLSDEIAELSCLSPSGKISDFVDWWSNSRYNKERNCIALVGHQPNLGHWTEILVWGNHQGKLVVKKAGIIGITLLDRVLPVGRSELFLLTSPKWLL
ncbi:MAG: phosphohistidine phosphatase SixA [Cyanobacteria bacterium P01_G01_bin.49]